jgi:probable HAF family extracellular repeat protein
MIELPPITRIPQCSAQHNGGCNSHATASNDNHEIAGYAENGVMGGQTCVSPQVFLYEGVVWGLDASGAPVIERTLPPVTGDAVSQAFGMNDAGIIVGASGGCVQPNTPPPPPQPLRAVLWRDGSLPLVLGTLGGHQAIAYGINEKGQVVGQSSLPGDAVVHMFLWQEGMPMKDLALLDDTGVGLVSINNRGEVVGWSCGPSETETPFPCGPLYWREGMKQPIDLNQLTQSPHLGICCASDINDSGEIVVAVFDPNYNGGDIRAAVLVPVQDQDEQGPWQNSQGQNATAVQRFALPSNTLQRLNAVQRFALPSNTLQRLNAHLHGWMNAR